MVTWSRRLRISPATTSYNYDNTNVDEDRVSKTTTQGSSREDGDDRSV